MKKFDCKVHNSMGSLPPQLFKYIDMANIKGATAEFNKFITNIATDFHKQLDKGAPKQEINLVAPNLFGMPVSLTYVASGTIGSVYKIQIGNSVFALKINRISEFGELSVMHIQNRARNIVNRAYIGSVFKYKNHKYSWVLSDFIERNTENSFKRATEKMYFAYLTKGLTFSDAHPGNIIDGKVIDIPSLEMHKNIKKLSRPQIDIVKKLANFIKTDDFASFKNKVDEIKTTDFAVLEYMFLSMYSCRLLAMWSGNKDKFKKFEDVVTFARREIINNKQAPRDVSR